jgi:hypothetical protein
VVYRWIRLPVSARRSSKTTRPTAARPGPPAERLGMTSARTGHLH